MKDFFKQHKKTLIGLLKLLAYILVITSVVLFLLFIFNIIYFDEGIQFNVELFNNFKNTWYGWLIIILIEIATTTFLCFVPGISMAFIILINTLYGSLWQSFTISLVGVFASSAIMYLIGKFGGRKIVEKMIGKQDCESASNLLNNKGIAYFPVMMLFPIFPDDALIMIAGTLNMSLKWFIPSIVVGRGIGVATIVFGFGAIPFDKFTTPLHWIIFIILSIIYGVLIFYLAHKVNVYIDKKRKIKNKNN